MKNVVCAIYDSKAELYKNPFMMRSKGEAVRAFMNLVNDNQSDIHNHPEDYTLFELGSYEDTTGKYENCLTPISLGVAIEFKKEQK